MEYKITNLVLGSTASIEINEGEFNRIKTALVNLFELYFFEEKIDLVTENFLEYEVELLFIASREMVFHDDDYFSMSHERNTVSRRIVNLLSACKMYIDQSIQHVNNMFGKNSEISELLLQEKTSQYDNNFGYRAMEALRNYTQHRGFPIQSLKFSSEWLDSDKSVDSRIHHTVVPLMKISELANDGKFKRSVLNEMLSINKGDDIDIRPLIRNYVEGIGKIHEKVRDAIHHEAEKWEGVIDDVIMRYKNEFGPNTSIVGLAIVAIDDKKHWIEKRSIFKKFIEKRKALENKNRLFENLHKSYASNEIRKKDI